MIVRRFEYDERGQLVRVFKDDGEKRSTTPELTYEWDENGRPIRESSSLPRRFEYDASGRFVREVVAEDHWESVSYDSLGRPAQETGDQPGLKDSTRYTYDQSGRLVESNSRWEYRGGKLPDETVFNRTVYTYDARGRIQSAVFYRVVPVGDDPTAPGAKLEVVQKFAFAYDEAGRVTSTGDETFEYDSRGRLIRIGLTSGSARGFYEYEYDCSEAAN